MKCYTYTHAYTISIWGTWCSCVLSVWSGTGAKSSLVDCVTLRFNDDTGWKIAFGIGRQVSVSACLSVVRLACSNRITRQTHGMYILYVVAPTDTHVRIDVRVWRVCERTHVSRIFSSHW